MHTSSGPAFPPLGGGKSWLALVFVAVLAMALLQLGWVDPGPLIAAGVFETLRVTTIAVFRRPAPPSVASSEPSTGEEDG